MKVTTQVLLVLFSVLLLIYLSHASLPSSVTSTLALIADDTFEILHNDIELLPPDFSNLNQTFVNESWYHTKYCGYEPFNSYTGKSLSRCEYGGGGDVFNISVKHGDNLFLKYYNSVVTKSQVWLEHGYLPDIFIKCITTLPNPGGFMAEITTNDSTVSSLSIDWRCTRGRPVIYNDDMIDLALNEGIFPFNATASRTSSWQSPQFGAVNQKGAWAKDPRANPPGRNITCINAEGDSCWSPCGKFSPMARWLFNVFNDTTYSYCHGVISLFHSSSIITTVNTSSFTFTAPLLVLEQDAILPTSTNIVMQSNQVINFTGCVTFAGNLTVSVVSDAQETSITPLYYQCRQSSSKFDNVNLQDDSSAESDDGCELQQNAEYGDRELTVIFYRKCPESGGTNQKMIIGVVVGVGGCLVIVVVLAGIILGVIEWSRRQKISKMMRATPSS